MPRRRNSRIALRESHLHDSTFYTDCTKRQLFQAFWCKLGAIADGLVPAFLTILARSSNDALLQWVRSHETAGKPDGLIPARCGWKLQWVRGHVTAGNATRQQSNGP